MGFRAQTQGMRVHDHPSEGTCIGYRAQFLGIRVQDSPGAAIIPSQKGGSGHKAFLRMSVADAQGVRVLENEGFWLIHSV